MIARRAMEMLGSSGSGGGWELIKSEERNIKYTNTSTRDIVTISCGNDVWTKDDAILVHIRAKSGKRNGYFYGSDTLCINSNAANNVTDYFAYLAYVIFSVDDNGNFTAAQALYGITGYRIASNGDITLRARYGASTSRTIDDTFVIDVYKLTLPNGKKFFE